ncbi:hypothetical protein [Phenylobacterium parvum]|uniref:hypothetical protein n=1 Tax=Phenylobacterium parvum TaxID=2201350 RepID=UPI0013A5AEBC|nr:hypothetical protein [Phenylobacterium parvum]
MGKRFKRWLASASLILVFSSPATAGIDRIDFKYTSMTHLGFSGSLASIDLDSKETMDLIANQLRSSGVTVTGISEGQVRFVQTEGDKACENWSNSIFRAELAAFAENKPKDYKRLNRSGQPVGCSVPKASWIQYAYSAQKMERGRSFTINGVVDRSVTFNQGGVRPSFGTIFNGYNIANIVTMVPTNSSFVANFQTMFIVHVWRDEHDEKTSVFVLALPKSDGVEASPGRSIGSIYRPYIDGRIEQTAAQNILSFVTQKAIMGK